VDIVQNAPDTLILAEDEASLYLQATLMRVWAPVGQTPVVKVAANRDNTHFYGALNLRTGEETVLVSDLMKAEVTVLFLNRLLQRHPEVPILLLWDRATWHQGEAIRSVLAANPRLQILCFPPGSPELNPQEHVWKATREAVSHNHTRKNLPDLVQAFQTHLETTRFPCSLLERHGYYDLWPIFN
jgi:transposase